MAKKTAAGASAADSWGRIERWLAEHARPVARSLARGATAARLRALEASLGASLPAGFKDALAVHDGQTTERDLIPDDGTGGFYLLPAEGIVREWAGWNAVLDAGDFGGKETRPDRGVAPDWWNRGWVPFASNGGGDNLCVDLAPARGGSAGQVILVRHDHPARTKAADSFEGWLRWLADVVEAGGIGYLIG